MREIPAVNWAGKCVNEQGALLLHTQRGAWWKKEGQASGKGEREQIATGYF